MLQLDIQTSSSNLIPILDFQYIYDLARCSKCQMFILLKSTNKLYGASDDACCIHEIDVPFLVNTDLMFRLDQVDKAIFETNKDFFIPEKLNWVIIPVYYWDMYKAGDLEVLYDSEVDQYRIIDKTTMLPIEQIQTTKVRYCNDFQVQEFINQLSGFLNRVPKLKNPEYFNGVEQDKAIRSAFDSKVTAGRFLCHMSNDNVEVLFYFFKGLFSLAKADTLDLEIRFDRFDSRLFMATFKPKKKKNPLTFNTYGIPFQERIHCMYMNMI